MKWGEIRNTYPHQWLKLKVLERHIEGDKEYIDDMEVIRTIESDIKATRELGRCKENEAVYHTYHNEIYYKLKNIFGFRMVKDDDMLATQKKSTGLTKEKKEILRKVMGASSSKTVIINKIRDEWKNDNN